MATLPLDDPQTYEMLARGDSIGVFQFESEGMREALKKVRPTEFDDLVALNALYRPGRDGPDPHLRARQARPASRSPTPTSGCAPILESTKGVILYQEQAMQIAKELAGFSGAKADDLRKAIGKKNREAMAKLKPEFVEGCRASGTSESVIEWLWTTNEKSADYSFNKSHAACYALIAYRTAWLKANYPAEYMAALISSVMDTKDKVPFFVAQAEQMGIEILPPDVNLSDHEFVVVDGNIRFGLDAVKGVGYAAVEAIKRGARSDGRRRSRRPVGLLRARRQPRGQQEGDRGADQVRRVRLDRRDRARACWPCSSRRRARARRPSRTRRSGRARSSTSEPDLGGAGGGDGGGRVRDAEPRRRSRRRVRPARAARRREGVDRPVHLRPPAQGGARGAARAVDCSLARARRAPRRRLGHGRRDDHRRPRGSAPRRATR